MEVKMIFFPSYLFCSINKNKIQFKLFNYFILFLLIQKPNFKKLHVVISPFFLVAWISNNFFFTFFCSYTNNNKFDYNDFSIAHALHQAGLHFIRTGSH